MISTEKKKKIDERCKALEKEFERRYKKETEVRGKKCFAVREDEFFIVSGLSWANAIVLEHAFSKTEVEKNMFEDGGTLRKLQKLFLRFSESSKTVESDAIRARNRIASFPSPIGVEEMTTFAIGTFISMGSKIVALSLNHIRCRIQRAQPIKIV